MHMRRIAPGLLFLLFVSATSAGAAEPDGKPGAFVTALAQRAMTTVNSESLTAPQREHKLQRLVEDGFDLSWIAKFLIGPYWEKADAGAQQGFMGVLRSYIVQLYADRFRNHKASFFRVVRELPRRPKSTIVFTEFTQSDEEAKILGWYVVEHDGGHRILDVIVDGISMARSKRDEFLSYLDRNGGDVPELTQRLQMMVFVQEALR